MRRNPLRHRRCHNRGHRDGMRGHRARLLPHLAEEIQQQHAHLVSADERIAVFALDGGTHAVAVRVGRKQQVAARLLRPAEADRERLPHLRVRVRAGGKVSVRVALLGRDHDIGKAVLGKAARNAADPRAVERRIHDGNAAVDLAREHGSGRHRVQIPADGLFTDPVNEAFLYSCFKIDTHDVRKRVNAVDGALNLLRGFGRDLAAIRPVDLVAVVFRGIVARGEHDTAAAGKVPHRKRKRRRGHDHGIQIDLNPVAREHLGRRAREHIALDAAVVGDGQLRLDKLFHAILAVSLRGFRHRIHVHPVRARADHAAKAAGAELQLPIEPVFDFGGRVFDPLQLLCQIRVPRRFVAPEAVGFLHVHPCITFSTIVFRRSAEAFQSKRLAFSYPFVTSASESA